MSATAAIPMTAAGLISEFTCRLMAFLLQRVRGLAGDMLPPVTGANRALVLAFADRLAVFTARATRIAERVNAGKLHPGRVRSERVAPRLSSEARAPRWTSVGVRLPQKFGWMLGFVTPEFRHDWTLRLTHPQMAGMIHAVPAFARELRWFTRGMGISAPSWIFPVMVRRARAAHDAEPASAIDSFPFARTDRAAPEQNAADLSAGFASEPVPETADAQAPQAGVRNAPCGADSEIVPIDAPRSAPLAQSVSGDALDESSRPSAPEPVDAAREYDPLSVPAILATGGGLGLLTPFYVGNPASAPAAATVLPVFPAGRSAWERHQDDMEIIARGAQLPPYLRGRRFVWRRGL